MAVLGAGVAVTVTVTGAGTGWTTGTTAAGATSVPPSWMAGQITSTGESTPSQIRLGNGRGGPVVAGGALPQVLGDLIAGRLEQLARRKDRRHHAARVP